MTRDEMNYYQLRAEAETEMAQRAQCPKAVQAHYRLASAYLDRIHGDSPKAGPNLLDL